MIANHGPRTRPNTTAVFNAIDTQNKIDNIYNSGYINLTQEETAANSLCISVCIYQTDYNILNFNAAV